MNETMTMREALAVALEHAAASLREPGTLLGADCPADPEALVADIAARPDRKFADFYMCGAPGLAAWRDRLGQDVAVFKAGLTRQGLARRQEDLREDEYASHVKIDCGYRRQPGFQRWEMRRIAPIQLDPAQSAVISFVPRAIRVALNGRTFDDVERRLRQEMKPWALDTWAAAPRNRSRLTAVGLDPVRFTAARFGNETVHKRSAELYVIRPRVDLPKIIEALVAAVT